MRILGTDGSSDWLLQISLLIVQFNDSMICIGVLPENPR